MSSRKGEHSIRYAKVSVLLKKFHGDNGDVIVICSGNVDIIQLSKLEEEGRL